jgi:hypothetical protein
MNNDNPNSNNLLNKIEKFIEDLGQKKMWVFGWGLFVTSLVFIVTMCGQTYMIMQILPSIML